jgi:zinc protease
MRWTRDVHRQVLPNGLTLLVQRDRSAPVVAVVTHVRAGYFDEPDDRVGIAHVLEHMYFKGTRRRGPGEIARETQLVGGYINAGTIYDRTVYYTVLPSARGGLERALDVQADALMHAALAPDELGRELEVIIQEARRKLDSPGPVTTEALYALLFRTHRMRRWRIGTEEELRRLTRDDLHAYYASRYTPPRTIVALVGDLDPSRTLELAAAAYGPWQRPAQTVAGSPAEVGPRTAAFRRLSGDVERPLVSLGWRTVGTLHDDAPALDMAATILGSGRGSRLYRTLRAPGVAASALASHYTPTEVGVFEIGIEAEVHRLDDAIAVALGLTETLAKAGPAASELERARALIATGWARRMESMDGRAMALCEAEALGDLHLADELYRRTLAVTGEEIAAVTARWLDSDSVCGVLYLPRTETGTVAAGAWPPAPAVPETVTAPVRRSRRLRPRPAPTAEPVRLPDGLEHRAFPGIDLLVRPKPGAGSCTVLLHFPGVPLLEAPRNAGVSWLLARSAARGAGGASGEMLALALESLGGALVPAVHADTMGWGATVAPSALTAVAGLLCDVAFAADLAPGEIELERAQQASDARRQRDDMFRHPLERVRALAFGEHPYGLPALGEPDRIGGYDRGLVAGWARTLAAHRPVAVVVGDFEAEDAVGRLWPLTTLPVPGPDDAQAPGTPGWFPTRGAEPRAKQQSALALAFPAAPHDSADRFPLAVTAALLSGLAGRLFDELREKRSLAYTVAAMPWLARHSGAMLCYIATSPEREDEAREAMIAELVRLRTEPPSAAELERARHYAAGTVEIGAQSAAAVAARVLDAWVYGESERWAETPDRLRGVTLDDVLRVAEEVFDPDRRAEFVVRGGAG